MITLGRFLIITGLVIALIGVILLVVNRYFPWLGHLPGDIRYETDNVKVYFPLATMLLLSILGTILLNIIIRLFNR